MTELPSDPAVEARLRDYLGAELRQAELDYPHHARPERAVARRRLPVGGALTVLRVGAPSPVSGVLVVDAVDWRQPTKGRIPEEAVPPQGGAMNEALVPDFVGVWGSDGVTIAGYMPKRYVLDGAGTTAGGSPSNPPQDLPIPVYGL